MTQHNSASSGAEEPTPSATSQVDKKIASRMWNAGKSARDIARRFGVTKNVIVGMAGRDRVHFPPKKPERPEIPDWRKRVNIEVAARMWFQDFKISAIAKHFEVYSHHIDKLIQERRDLFPKRKQGGNRPKLVKSSTPKQRVQRVNAERDIFVQKLFEAPSLTHYDAERMPFAKTLVDLDRNECKFALTNHTPHLFCAAEAKGNYCCNHAQRSYRAA